MSKWPDLAGPGLMGRGPGMWVSVYTQLSTCACVCSYVEEGIMYICICLFPGTWVSVPSRTVLLGPSLGKEGPLAEGSTGPACSQPYPGTPLWGKIGGEVAMFLSKAGT